VTWPFVNTPEPPETPTSEVVAHYQEVLDNHADDPVTKVCRLCCVHRCQDWCKALLWLIDAGENPEEPVP
jgi:hypothetical protein